MTAIASYGGTALLRRQAHRWGLIDIPNERSLHSRPTPRGGGIVLVASVCLGFAIAVVAGAVTLDVRAAGIGVPALVVAVLGWRDDVRSLPAALRFAVHLLAAAGAIALLGTFDRIQLPEIGDVYLPPVVAAAVTTVWLVGLLNAYNFMDGIDGLATGQAIVVATVWIWAVADSLPLVTVTALLIVAASVGFLWHNWSPARIFMGDAGSGFLGFTFAALPLLAYHSTGHPRLFPAGVMVLWPFVFDTAFTLARRLLRRENVLRAHRTHLYQRLVTAGWSHRNVALLYLLLATSSGMGAVLWLRGGSGWVLAWPCLAVSLMPILVLAAERGRSRARNRPSSDVQ